MPSLNELLDYLGNFDFGCRVGIAGSYARGTANLSSDIDVVVDTDMLDIPDIELIKSSIKDKFNKESDVICLGLLESEDKELDSLLQSVDLGINDCSAYKSICREVIWCDKVIQ